MTLIEKLTPNVYPNERAYDIILIIGGIFSLAVAAQISIAVDFSPVPITAQTLALVLIAFCFGLKRAMITVLLYVGLVVLGLPFLSGLSSGLEKLTGASGGYLMGFIVATYLIAYFSENTEKIHELFILFLIGHIVIMFFGVIWLYQFVGEQVMTKGLIPFLPGLVIKVLLATLIIMFSQRKHVLTY